MIKLAAGYLRCSTEEQGATSIPQQMEEILQWAKANGFTIIKWFIDEGKSGTDFKKRPGFCRMSEEVNHGADFQFVIVYDESRWGRAMNPRENNYWKMHFEKSRVKVRMVHSSSKNEDDIGSYVVEVVESAEASEYSKKLSRATLRGMLSPQQGGYSRGGTAPYGYKRVAIDLQTREEREMRDGAQCVPKQEKVKFELGNPLEVETVKLIFDLKSEGLGIVSIADRLNERKIPCPRRGRWRNFDQKWSGGTVRTILMNQTYTGDRVYNRLSFSKFVAKSVGLEYANKIVHDKSKWLIIPNAHPPIVPKDLFEKVNKNISISVSKVNQHYYRSSYLLSGLIKCTKCTYNYQGSTHKQSGNRYYVDGGFINKGKSVCGWFSIDQDYLEAYIKEGIKEILSDNNFHRMVESALTSLIEGEPSANQSEGLLLESQLKDVELKIKNLVDLAEKGINLESIAVRINELEQQQKDRKLKLLAIGKPVQFSRVDRLQVSKSVCEFFQNFEKNFDQAPQDEKKELVRKIVEKILIDTEANTITCYFRRIPKIDEALELNKSEGLLLGAHSSANGNRTRI